MRRGDITAYHSMLSGRSQQARRSRTASYFAACSLPPPRASACLCMGVGYGAEYPQVSQHALTVGEY